MGPLMGGTTLNPKGRKAKSRGEKCVRRHRLYGDTEGETESELPWGKAALIINFPLKLNGPELVRAHPLYRTVEGISIRYLAFRISNRPISRK